MPRTYYHIQCSIRPDIQKKTRKKNSTVGTHANLEQQSSTGCSSNSFEKDFVLQIVCSLLWCMQKRWFSKIEGNTVLIKEGLTAYCLIHCFGTSIWYKYRWCNWLLKIWKVCPLLVVSVFPFYALFFLTHYSAYCFLWIHGCNTPVAFFFVDHNIWEYACLKLAQDRTP